jgi:hypothetical protein
LTEKRRGDGGFTAVSGLFTFVVNCLVLEVMQVSPSGYEDDNPLSFQSSPVNLCINDFLKQIYRIPLPTAKELEAK